MIPMLEPFFVHSKSLFSAQNLSKIKATKKKLMKHIRKMNSRKLLGRELNYLNYQRMK